METKKRKTWLLSTKQGLVFTLLTAIFVLASVYFLTPAETGFAKRWNGGCTGWTRSLAIAYMVYDTLMFVCYSMIAAYVYLLHPTLSNLKKGRLTVWMVAFIFWTCAVGHLLISIANFHPCYNEIFWFQLLSSIVAIAGTPLVGHDLSYGKEVIDENLRRIESAQNDMAG